MAKKYNKREIIEYGQELFEKIGHNIKSYFRQRPLLPGYGKINSDFFKYNIKITFNLNKIIEARDLDKNLNIELELTEMAVNDMQLSLVYHIYNCISKFDLSFNIKDINSIIKLAKYHRKSYLIFSQDYINEIKGINNFIEVDYSFLVGKNELFKIGTIEDVDIYINPLEENPKRVLLINDNFIEYGIIDNTENIEYKDVGNKILAECSFYDICYKINPDLNFKVLLLE